MADVTEPIAAAQAQLLRQFAGPDGITLEELDDGGLRLCLGEDRCYSSEPGKVSAESLVETLRTMGIDLKAKE